MSDETREPSTPLGEPAESEQNAARQAVDAMVQAGLLDRVLAQADSGELRLTGEGGFLPEMVKRVLEAGLQAELTDHLGYDRHDPAGRGSGNSRNGSTAKRLGTEVGDLDLATPRDRNGTFEPQLVGKGQRRLDGLSDMIISLYAKGMTVRDIQHHLRVTLGSELSHETISNITEAVAAEVKAWQARPLEAIYPIIYLDALVVKVRDGHTVRNKAAHLAVGVDTDGIKHVLGIWVQSSEGAKFWLGVLAELANRGVADALIVCCDGLTGLPEAIEATWPKAVVQTCTVHLIRASLRFVPDMDRKAVAAALKMIYTAPTASRGRCRAGRLRRLDLGQEVSGDCAGLAGRLGTVHPVPGVPAGAAPDHLYHQQRRVAALPAAQDHQEPRPLPQRRRRGQAAVAGDSRHRRPSRPRTSQRGRVSQRPAPQSTPETRRRRPGPALEPSPRRPHHGLPRPTGTGPMTSKKPARSTRRLTQQT